MMKSIASKLLINARNFLFKQSEEMKVALWLENIDRKTKDMDLSAEQKQILDIIKDKFVTVEFATTVIGKEESEAPPEDFEIINKATLLLGKARNEIIYRNLLKPPDYVAN